jgi:hypothetical protein
MRKMGHQTHTDFLVIQGKRGELLAAAVMLSMHGIEVAIPSNLISLPNPVGVGPAKRKK